MDLATGEWISLVKNLEFELSGATYSGKVVACLFAAAAVVLTLCTAMPKLPETADEQPGGAGATGEMAAVTACGRATGLA